MSTQIEDTQLEIVNSRQFDVSCEVLFDAFANPDCLVRWWGPEGFTNTFTVFEFNPAGAWHSIMHAQDGTEYPNESRFVEICRPERIVFEHLQPGHHYVMTMTFDEVASGSRLTWKMVSVATEENLKFRDFIVAANEQNFDRLGRVLETFR